MYGTIINKREKNSNKIEKRDKSHELLEYEVIL